MAFYKVLDMSSRLSLLNQRAQHAKVIAIEKASREQRWICSLAGRMSFGKLLVAIANKHARQIWAMLAHDVDYDAHASLRYPMRLQTLVA